MTNRLDSWCYVRLPDGRKTRGRLVARDDELLLFKAGPTLERFALSSLNVPARSAVTVDGATISWQKSCSCGWPASLKGPVELLLERLTAA